MEDPEREAFKSSNVTFLPEDFKGTKERPCPQPSFKDIYPQVISSCIAHTLVIQAGINMAYSAILLPQLMADDSTFIITKTEASWIASLMAISTPVGALVCGPFMDLLGRKLFSIITTIPFIVSWFLQVFTPNYVSSLYIARILAGFGGGLTTVSLVYISEISDPSWRPMLLCLNSVFVSFGILVTNVLGVMLPWRTVALCSGCLTIASAVAILFYNPESPHWLLTFRPHSDKAFEQAKASVQRLYSNKQMFSKEWDRIVSVSQEKRKEVVAKQDCGAMEQFSTEFTKRSSVLPLILLMVIFFFQQLSGTYPIIFYAVQVFQSIGGKFGAGLDADSATIILGIIRFATSLLTAGLSRSFGRRHLLIVSGVGMTISAFIAALYFDSNEVFSSVFDKNGTNILSNSTLALKLSMSSFETTTSVPLDNDLNSQNYSNTVGLFCILLFVTMSSVGFLVIPWTLIGEILPLSIRGVGGGLIISYAYILMFVVVKLFPFILDILHISGCFYLFSFTSFINVTIVYFFLPETLGKSFEEIDKWFSK